MVPSISPELAVAMTTTTTSSSSRTPDRFDFHVVDSVYGRNSDLYQDVLGVPPNASRKEIRAAFVDSRDEFFQFQSQVERGDIVVTDGQLDFSKRRMDAVVAAFRILHDPNLRAFYDEARENRMHQGKIPENNEKDPVVQAVSRALGEKQSSPKRSSAEKSPLESSSGFDSPTSSIVMDRRQSSSSPRRSLRGAFSSKRTKAAKASSTANYVMQDTTKPIKSARRQGRFSTTTTISDDSSIPGDDIGASRNYRSERKRSNETVSTSASSHQDDDDDERSGGSNSLVASTTDVIDDASTAASYYMMDDDLMVVEEEADLGALCCSPQGARFASSSRRDRTLVGKTRTLLRAVKAEIRGSIKDTTSAFDQVFNAFTLQEKDIQAVTSKIDKASRQLRG